MKFTLPRLSKHHVNKGRQQPPPQPTQQPASAPSTSAAVSSPKSTKINMPTQFRDSTKNPNAESLQPLPETDKAQFVLPAKHSVLPAVGTAPAAGPTASAELLSEPDTEIARNNPNEIFSSSEREPDFPTEQDNQEQEGDEQPEPAPVPVPRPAVIENLPTTKPQSKPAKTSSLAVPGPIPTDNLNSKKSGATSKRSVGTVGTRKSDKAASVATDSEKLSVAASSSAGKPKPKPKAKSRFAVKDPFAGLSMKQKREKLQEMQTNAATKVQALARGHLTRTGFYTEQQKRNEAAVVIQAGMRRKLAENELHRRRVSKHAALAAVRIQSAARGFLAYRRAVQLRKERAAALVIQSVVRMRMARRLLNNLRQAQFEHLQRTLHAITRTQALIRGFLAVQLLKRMRQERQLRLRQEHAALLIQSLMRRLLAVRRVREIRIAQAELRARRQRAATLIQALFFGHRARVRVRQIRTEIAAKRQRLLRATVLIQSAMRGFLAIKRVDRIRKARILAEAQRRAEEKRRTDAAIVIQKTYRGFVARTDYQFAKEIQHAATKVQAAFRGHVARKQIQAIREHELAVRDTMDDTSSEESDIDLPATVTAPVRKTVKFGSVKVSEVTPRKTAHESDEDVDLPSTGSHPIAIPGKGSHAKPTAAKQTKSAISPASSKKTPQRTRPRTDSDESDIEVNEAPRTSGTNSPTGDPSKQAVRSGAWDLDFEQALSIANTGKLPQEQHEAVVRIQRWARKWLARRKQQNDRMVASFKRDMRKKRRSAATGGQTRASLARTNANMARMSLTQSFSSDAQNTSIASVSSPVRPHPVHNHALAAGSSPSPERQIFRRAWDPSPFKETRENRSAFEQIGTSEEQSNTATPSKVRALKKVFKTPSTYETKLIEHSPALAFEFRTQEFQMHLKHISDEIAELTKLEEKAQEDIVETCEKAYAVAKVTGHNVNQTERFMPRTGATSPTLRIHALHTSLGIRESPTKMLDTGIPRPKPALATAPSVPTFAAADGTVPDANKIIPKLLRQHIDARLAAAQARAAKLLLERKQRVIERAFAEEEKVKKTRVARGIWSSTGVPTINLGSISADEKYYAMMERLRSEKIARHALLTTYKVNSTGPKEDNTAAAIAARRRKLKSAAGSGPRNALASNNQIPPKLKRPVLPRNNNTASPAPAAAQHAEQDISSEPETNAETEIRRVQTANPAMMTNSPVRATRAKWTLDGSPSKKGGIKRLAQVSDFIKESQELDNRIRRALDFKKRQEQIFKERARATLEYRMQYAEQYRNRRKAQVRAAAAASSSSHAHAPAPAPAPAPETANHDEPTDPEPSALTEPPMNEE